MDTGEVDNRREPLIIVEPSPDGPRPGKGERYHLFGTWGPQKRWSKHRYQVVGEDAHVTRTFATEPPALRFCSKLTVGGVADAFVWDAECGARLPDSSRTWTAPHGRTEGDAVAVQAMTRAERRRRPGGRQRRRKLPEPDPRQGKLFE